MAPCFGSWTITSSTGPPRTQPTDTVSLKKIARGFLGLMRGAWKLVFENTSTCDSTGTCRTFSSDSR